LQTNGISPTISPTTNQTAIYLVKQAATILKANIMKGTNFTNYNLTRENLGFSISTMLVSCYFNGIQCYSTDFYLYETFDYGNCYTFNGLKNSDGSDASVKQTTKSGPNSGLILELFTGVGGSQDYYTIKSGVFVLVHNNSVKPLVQYDGVNVQTGTSTNIRVSRTFSSKLDLPYSNCRADLTVLESDSVYYKLTSKFTEYKQKLCFDYYKQINIAIANCNCNDPSLPLVLEKNSNICSNTISLNCIEGFKRNTSFSISNDDCPMECDSIDYSLNIDSAVYPSSYYSSILTSLSFIKSKFVVSNTFSPKAGTSFSGSSPGSGTSSSSSDSGVTVSPSNSSSGSGSPSSSQTITLSDIQSCFVMVSVFYENLEYTTSEESPAFDFNTLLGVIGKKLLDRFSK
jgi:hypothetical protein